MRGGTEAMRKVMLDKWPTRELLMPFARECAAKYKIALIYSFDHISELANQRGFEVILDLDGDVVLPDTAKTVDARGCTALTSLDAKAAKTVYASGCTALTSLDAKAAKTVDASGCTALKR
jgi:hypothetical protein